MMPPDPRKGLLKVKENGVKGRLVYKSFINFGLKAKKGLGWYYILYGSRIGMERGDCYIQDTKEDVC